MNNSSEPNPVTTGTDKVPAFPPSFVYPVATCHILIVAVAALGNFIVCYAIIANKSLRSSPTNLFIFSLAFSDLLTVTLAVPFDIEGLFLNWAWKHGEMMCEAWITVYLITVPTSILTLLALSVDRYKSLEDPLNRFRRFRFMTRKKALIVISVIWLYTYSRTLRSSKEKRVYLRNVRAAKTISIFVAVFFFCWVPHSSISITANLCKSCQAKIPHEVRVVFVMFGYLNSALNPFLFAFRNRRFK
ncbi:unnamed protein product, partial [Porites evermanni]